MSYSITHRLCAFVFFWDLVFVYAIDKLLFLSRGLTMPQVALLMSVWAGANILLEIPSGILADRWNRKYLLVISGVARVLMCAAWLFVGSFWGFLVGLVFLAVSQSFLSGTAQAYLHDALSENGREEEFEQNWGLVESARLAGLAIAWTVGGLVSGTSYVPSIVLSLGSGVLCFLVALALPNIRRVIASTEENPFHHLAASLTYAWKHDAILRIFLFAAIVRSSYVIVDEYWSVFFDSLGVSPTVFGMLVGISTLSGSAAGLVAHRFKSRPWATIGAGTILLSVVLATSFFSRSVAVVPLMLSPELIVGVLYVLSEGQIQKHAAKDKRATISSVASLLKETGILTGIAFGWIVSRWDIRTGYLFFAAFVLLYFPVTWIVRSIGKNSQA